MLLGVVRVDNSNEDLEGWCGGLSVLIAREEYEQGYGGLTEGGRKVLEGCKRPAEKTGGGTGANELS